MKLRRDQSFLRETNLSLIMNLLRVHGRLSRVDICRLAHLSPPTASALVSELQGQELLREAGSGRSNGGRSPILYELNPRGVVAIGIDQGISWVRTTIVDLAGNIRVSSKVNVKSLEYDYFLQTVLEEVRNVCKKAEISLSKIYGIGMGLHGLVDSEDGMIRFSPHYRWHNVRIVDDLVNMLPVPVVIDNDVRAMARGEHSYGAARKFSDFVVVNVGDGVGSAVMVNGRFIAGATNGAGEIGHLIVDDEGIHCECGNYGCLTVMADGASIARQAIKRIKQGEKSLLSEQFEGKLTSIRGEHISQAADEGDLLSQRVLADAGRYLGIALANIVNLLNPPLILLGGGVAESGDAFWQATRDAVTSRAMAACVDGVSIRALTLGEWAGAVGAAALALEPIFAGPRVEIASEGIL